MDELNVRGLPKQEGEFCLARFDGKNYLIRFCDMGMFKGEMFNPFGIDEDRVNPDKIEKSTNSPKFPFRGVHKDVYNNYVQFLKTKRNFWYREARNLHLSN